MKRVRFPLTATDFRILFGSRATALCFALALGLLATGCAFTRTPVQVTLTPTASNPLQQPASAPLAIGAVKDTRPVKDGFVLTQKYNGYGQRTSGAYIAQEPVAEIFRKGLQVTLEQNGFLAGSGSEVLTLTADIQEFEHDVITGFVKATVTPKLIVRFQLMDNASGAAVWHDTFVGRENMETAWGNSSFLVETFTRAADNVLKQLISDANFRNAISRKRQ